MARPVCPGLLTYSHGSGDPGGLICIYGVSFPPFAPDLRGNSCKIISLAGWWMMARMLSQLPLPLLQAGAAEIAPGVGLLAGEDGGLVAFAWDAGDEAGRRLAAVQLVRLRAASRGQVAEAFGVDPATIWRWDQALACGGVAGLVPVRRGPKGASKLTPALAARIAGLDAAGQTLRQIAAATGVSTFTVRAALGRVRPGGQAPAAGGEAGQGSGQPARTPAPGRFIRPAGHARWSLWGGAGLPKRRT